MWTSRSCCWPCTKGNVHNGCRSLFVPLFLILRGAKWGSRRGCSRNCSVSPRFSPVYIPPTLLSTPLPTCCPPLPYPPLPPPFPPFSLTFVLLPEVSKTVVSGVHLDILLHPCIDAAQEWASHWKLDDPSALFSSVLQVRMVCPLGRRTAYTRHQQAHFLSIKRMSSVKLDRFPLSPPFLFPPTSERSTLTAFRSCVTAGSHCLLHTAVRHMRPP